MSSEVAAELAARAAVHRALGDPHRLAIVDALRLSDRSPGELATITGLGTNLVAFHLGVLEDADLVARTPSQGDARRRYVRLQPRALASLLPSVDVSARNVLFVCTHNAARSQLAAALWQRVTGRPGTSAGSQPSERVHPLAIAEAARHGIDLSAATPRGYDGIDHAPDLVVSVCDRAHEAGPPFAAPTLHWSVPDPIEGGPQDFASAYAELAARIEVLAASTRAA